MKLIFKVLQYAPPYFNEITKHMPMVREQGQIFYIPEPEKLVVEYFLQKDLERFYSYHGSMLLDKCIKDVIWFDFSSALSVKPDFVSVKLTTRVNIFSNNFFPRSKMCKTYEIPRTYR